MNIRLSKRSFMRILDLCFIAVVLQYSVANAGAGWLDKGKGFLESFGKNGDSNKLSIEEIGSGLKEALHVGSENVVDSLGRTDGFNKDAQIHIPLPQQLASVKSVLGRVGMSGMLDDLELKLNRAAEVATPKAKKIFHQAITAMTIEDAKAILDGPKDAATQYFRKQMSPSLAAQMQPIVNNSLSEVGAVKAYDESMAQYESLPFAPDVKSDLTGYVVQKGIDGIFYYMAKEEAAIRNNPVKRSTDLLKRVFSRQ